MKNQGEIEGRLNELREKRFSIVREMEEAKKKSKDPWMVESEMWDEIQKIWEYIVREKELRWVLGDR